MSSRKRSFEALGGDDEDVDVESASSSLRQNAQKRPRAVLAAEQGGSTVSDDDNDEDIPDSLSRLGSMMPQAPIHSDDDEDEDFDIDEVRGTQYVARQMRKRRENVEMDNGIIEEIFCRNFMCHTKLRITLGPLINFIIGHNGSGKSAVMTALTMCLGGKTAATNRGSNLRSMIKEGQETATLAVKIKNQGEGAYRPDVYGKSITVERHFSRASSASTWKIKNAQDRIVSTKKRDLDDIIDYFALQLDNPINVLNQDMARQFLSSSSASDKYKFFIRGTQLETLDADYKLIEENLDVLEARLHNREDDIKILQNKAKEAEARKKRLEASDSIRLEVLKTQRMHAWAQVEEQEHIVENCNKEISLAEAQLEKAEHQAETAAGAFEAGEQAYVQAQNRSTELQNALEPAKVEYDKAQDDFNAGRTRLLDMQATLRNTKADFKNEQQKRAKLEEQISAERQRLAEANGHEHVERLEQLDRLRAALEVAENGRTTHDGVIPGLEDARDVAERAFRDAEQPLSEQRHAVERAEAALSNLRKDQNQRFAGYPRNVERLLQMIDRETRWRNKPVGPVGQHVRLKKAEWTNLIERTLDRLLNNFVVTCREDQVTLADLMKRAGYQASIIIGHATPLDTTGKEPSDDVDTVLRVLDIDNDLVRNQLIITQAIEQVVLMEDRRRGQDYLLGGARPTNVKAVIVMHDDRSGGGVRLDFSRSGSLRYNSLKAWTTAPRMQTSREQQILNQSERVAVAKRELDRLEQELRRVRQQHESAKQLVVRARRARTENTTIVQQISDNIDSLQDDIERNRPHDGRLQELERQLSAAKDAEDSQRDIVEDLVREKATLDESQKDTKSRLDAITEELAGHGESVEAAISESRKLADKRMNALRQKNEAFAAIEDGKGEVQARTKERDTQQKVLEEDFLSEAEKVCARIPVEAGMTPTKLDEKLERFQRDLEQAQRVAGGTLEELTMAWKESKMVLRRALKDFKDLKIFAQQMKNSLTERRRRWNKFRQFISSRARCSFMYLLSERNFRGRVILDHQDKMLELSVEPDLTRRSDVGREVRTLSGGEKSFSTICLLLSIWEAMGSPIRCLDEFDVFMDSANRSMSMNLIIQAARRAVGRQFIFITPQSMGDVDSADDVRCHRMADPERGQQALPFTQA